MTDKGNIDFKGRDWITQGYSAFRKAYFPTKKDKFESLGKFGQSPEVLIIACSDSRADPAMIFDADPGDLFVVRNVANIVPPFAPDDAMHGTGAALEYAVKVLKVDTIIVMGHEHCGGIAAHISGGDAVADDKFIGNWISCLDQVKQPTLAPGEDIHPAMEKAAILQSLDNLRGYDFVAQAVESGQTELVGAYFQIETGVLHLANDEGVFEPLMVD